jgi:hypothetical protein
MNFFSSKSKNDPPAAGQGTGNFASGAEQDRYASHLTGAGEAAAEKIKGAAWKAATYKGEGAEQDRYGSHFSGLSLDQQLVRKAAESIKAAASEADPNRHTGWFGLGYDGQTQARLLASGKGAEQVRVWNLGMRRV